MSIIGLIVVIIALAAGLAVGGYTFLDNGELFLAVLAAAVTFAIVVCVFGFSMAIIFAKRFA